MQHWYDGYKFGNTDQIYNPWSVVNYIDRHEEGFKPWWINTGTDSLIKKRIIEPDLNQTYNTLQQLIAGETLKNGFMKILCFPILKPKIAAVDAAHLFGYLTQTKHIKSDKYKLKIPNYEIKYLYRLNRHFYLLFLPENFKIKCRFFLFTYLQKYLSTYTD